MKNYYAADNRYSSSSSIGFANTWFVLVFDNKKDRDDYVVRSTGLAAKAIKRAEVSLYADAPKPFSGKCRRVVKSNADDTSGLVGEIVVDWVDGGMGEKF